MIIKALHFFGVIEDLKKFKRHHERLQSFFTEVMNHMSPLIPICNNWIQTFHSRLSIMTPWWYWLYRLLPPITVSFLKHSVLQRLFDLSISSASDYQLVCFTPAKRVPLNYTLLFA